MESILLTYITIVGKRKCLVLVCYRIIDTQVARRGRQYHRNPKKTILTTTTNANDNNIKKMMLVSLIES